MALSAALPWIAAAGDFLGGIGGLFGGNGGGRSRERDSHVIARQEAEITARRMPSFVAEGLRQAGIHPVVGLGGGAQFPTVGAIGGGSSRDTGAAIANMGQGISRAASAYVSPEDRQTAKMSAALQLENQHLQNERLRSEIALMHTGGTPGISSDPDADARYPKQSHMPLGFGDTAPLLRVGKDQKGNLVRVYNDDLGDNEVLQALTAFGFSVPDWIHQNLVRPAGKALRRKQFRQGYMPKKGG